jgi:signal peptidase I
MKPTLLEGDFILVKKFTYDINIPIINKNLFHLSNPKNGDVIVFKNPQKINMIKRIVAIPNETVIYNNKLLYIDGNIQKQYDIGSTVDKNINGLILNVRRKKEIIKDIKHDIYHIIGLKNRKYEFNNILVPKKRYFVMGDFRDNSQDSRIWGLVSKDQIIGKAVLIWMSWDNNNSDIRWNRIGKSIL